MRIPVKTGQTPKSWLGEKFLSKIVDARTHRRTAGRKIVDGQWAIKKAHL